jgi:methionine synthase II (cobalamin-independent)
LCIPSPSHIFGEWSFSREQNAEQSNDSYYQEAEVFKQDLANAYQEFLSDYSKIGGKIIQFDDCLWEMFSTDNPNSPFTGGHIDQASIQISRKLSSTSITASSTMAIASGLKFGRIIVVAITILGTWVEALMRRLLIFS